MMTANNRRFGIGTQLKTPRLAQSRVERLRTGQKLSQLTPIVAQISTLYRPTGSVSEVREVAV